MIVHGTQNSTLSAAWHYSQANSPVNLSGLDAAVNLRKKKNNQQTTTVQNLVQEITTHKEFMTEGRIHSLLLDSTQLSQEAVPFAGPWLSTLPGLAPCRTAHTVWCEPPCEDVVPSREYCSFWDKERSNGLRMEAAQLCLQSQA